MMNDDFMPSWEKEEGTVEAPSVDLSKVILNTGGGDGVVPATKGVKLRVRTAKLGGKKELVKMSVGLQLVDGIDESGKYKNKVFFEDFTLSADVNVYTKPYFTEYQYLKRLKALAVALGMGDNLTFDAETLGTMLGKELIGDIAVKEETYNGETKQVNTVRYFKSIA